MTVKSWTSSARVLKRLDNSLFTGTLLIGMADTPLFLVCTLCGLSKPVECFYGNMRSRGERGLRCRCKECHISRCCAYYLKNREEIGRKKRSLQKENPGLFRNRDLKHNYGITSEDYEAMLQAQGGVCAICKDAPANDRLGRRRLHVDHCHATGKVRGILCHFCNIFLGHVKERVDVLNSAILYLEGHR